MELHQAPNLRDVMLLWSAVYVLDFEASTCTKGVFGVNTGVGPPGSGLVISGAYTMYK